MLFLYPFFAAAGAPNDWMSFLASTGVAGAVLAFLLIRLEPRMKGMEIAQTRLARAQLLLVISLDSSTKGAKIESRAMIGDIDETLISLIPGMKNNG